MSDVPGFTMADASARVARAMEGQPNFAALAVRVMGETIRRYQVDVDALTVKLAAVVGVRLDLAMAEVDRRMEQFDHMWGMTGLPHTRTTSRLAALESVYTDATKGWF